MPPSRADSTERGTLGTRCLHVVVLSSLAFAQPILDLLTRHPSFFVIRRFERIEIFGLVAVLLLLIPLPAVLLEVVLSRTRPSIARAGHLALVALYGSVLALLVMRRADWLPAAVAVIAAIGVGFAAAALYHRFAAARSFVSLLAIALVLIPGAFFMNAGVRKLLTVRQAAAADLLTVDAEAPIIFVVFDEFNLPVLLDADREINGHRYPNLAKLAGRATWYRNAVTIAENTRIAVSALLTGVLPDADTLPSLEDHPNNLFTLVAGSHDLWVREPITRLAPEQLNRRTTVRPLLPWARSLASDLGIVYLHLLLPAEAAERLPSISYAWGGFAGVGRVAEPQDEPPPSGRPQTRRQKLGTFFENAVSALDDDRGDEIAGFLEPIRRGGAPQLHFLHILLPHRPWEYLADGRRYPFDPSVPIGMKWDVWQDQFSADQTYQRYIVQTQYLDAFIGRLIERLEGAELFDRSLIAIVGDHGVAFTEGEHRRLASLGNAAEILSVPLIVKAPYQEEGRIDDRLVSTLDLFPTMVDHLGIEPPWPMDGVSLVDASAAAERPLQFVTVKRGIHTVEPEYVERVDELVDRKLELFGDGTDPMGLYRFGPRGELVGRPVADFESGEPVGAAFRLRNRDLVGDVRPDSGYLPSLLQGQVRLQRPWPEDLVFAFAVNGTISATTRCRPEPTRWRYFSVLVAPEIFRSGANGVEAFAVFDRGGRVLLRQLLPEGGA